jgi:hypothetical protein
LYQPTLDLQTISRLTGNEHGVHDMPCPFCSDLRKAPNRRKAVLRVWSEPGFATFHCAHCGAKGHSRDPLAPRLDSNRLARARAEAAERERDAAWGRILKARWLWERRLPLAGSPAEKYLRLARGYCGLPPATLGYLPPRGTHPPALIAAFGVPDEPMPGAVSIRTEAVRAVHITRLRSDGLGKADHTAKIMVGRPRGEPLVLAPPNDSLGLAITEGIEDALSVHAATGLGVWAAGSASQMPALADVVPGYIDAVTIFADDDDAGWRGAAELARRLRLRGIEAGIVKPELGRAVA